MVGNQPHSADDPVHTLNAARKCKTFHEKSPFDFSQRPRVATYQC